MYRLVCSLLMFEVEDPSHQDMDDGYRIDEIYLITLHIPPCRYKQGLLESALVDNYNGMLLGGEVL